MSSLILWMERRYHTAHQNPAALRWMKTGRAGGISRILCYPQLLFASLISILFFSCGIPTPIYLAPPDNINVTENSFSHAHRNDSDIFEGYEVFYHLFDRLSPPEGISDIENPNQWLDLAESRLTAALRTNPGLNLMNYQYTSSNTPDHGFRRAFHGNYDTPLPVSVMVPFSPATVSLAGGESSYRFSLSHSVNASDLLLSCTDGSNPIALIAPEGGTNTYNTSAIQLYRRVITDTDFEILSFFDTSNSNADDLPENFETLSAAFFVSTSGFDPDNPGAIVVSSLVYIGNIVIH